MVRVLSVSSHFIHQKFRQLKWSDEVMYAAGEAARDSIELAVSGARQGLLPWSRSKLVATHMRAAMDFYDAGDKDKALWAVNMALSLDPTVVEGQKLRKQ